MSIDIKTSQHTILSRFLEIWAKGVSLDLFREHMVQRALAKILSPKPNEFLLITYGSLAFVGIHWS